jgi:probable phosphoglycerate mutase
MRDPGPARLLLVRHGQIAANITRLWHGSTDSPLTPLGHDQAQRVAAHLARTRPAVRAVYTSPLARARHTAVAIGTAFGLPPQVAPGLAEYGIGMLEGESYADLVDRHGFFAQAHADLDWAPPGGESLRAVSARVLAAWGAMAAAHPGAEVVVVSHGAAMAAGIAALLHDDPRQWQRYHVRNTSVSELTLAPAVLVVFDRVEHLEDG